MARLRQNFQHGTVDNSPLTIGGTTLNSTELATLLAVAGPDILAITLDPQGDDGDPEIVHVTAHTGGATSATILRAQEGTVARAHNAGTEWSHNITEDDFTYSTLAGLPTIPTAGVDVLDEGVSVGQAEAIDFTGAGKTVSFAGTTATVDIPGGGAGITPLDLKPVLWCPVHEGVIGAAAAATSTNLIDFSGMARHGTVNGNPTFQTAVINSRNIVRGDGTGDFWSHGNVLGFERNNPFTLFWVGNLSATNVYLHGKQSNTTGRGWGWLSLADQLNLWLSSTATTSELRVRGATNITTMGAFVACATYDGSSAAAGIELYINGVAETKTTVVNNLTTTIVDNTVPLVTGGREAGTFPLNGDYADGAIFPYLFTTDQRDAMTTYFMDLYGL